MAENMGEVIRRLRKERDMTQEELAEQIGVTSQAISKWENNTGLPDISQIVPLANFFGVSTDTLFDFCSEDKVREIKDYEERSQKLRHKGLNEENLALWREAFGKHPGDYTCMSRLSYALSSCASQETDQGEREAYVKEEIALCERILSGCTDSDLRSGAIQLLVYAYGDNTLSFADEDKAVSYANMGGSIYTCSEILLESAFFTENGKTKALKQKDQNLLDFTDLICLNLSQQETENNQDKIRNCTTALTLWNTLIPDGNFLFYHCRLYMLYSQLAVLHAKTKNQAETLKALQKAKKHAKQFDKLPNGKTAYTSPFVFHAICDAEGCTKNYSESECELFFSDLSNSCFDFLRDDPDFIALYE